MKEEYRRIGIRELFAMILLSVGIKLTDMTPTNFIQKEMNASWIVVILSGILFFIPFLIIIHLLHKYQKKNLVDLLFIILGKPIGMIVAIVLWFMVLSATVINSRSYVDILNTMFFPETPIIILYLILIGTSLSLARFGIDVIGRISWLLLPYIKFSLLLLIIFTLKELRFGRIFPIFGPGIVELFKEGINRVSLFGELFIFAAIFPLVKNFKEYRNGNILAMIFLIIEISMFFLVFATFFEFASAQNVLYPFHELTRFVRFGAVSHIETFFLAFWLAATFIRYSIYLYLLTYMFSYLLNMKDFKPLLITFGGLVILLGLIPENPVVYNFHIREVVLRYSSYTFLFLPPVLWVSHKWKGRKRV